MLANLKPSMMHVVKVRIQIQIAIGIEFDYDTDSELDLDDFDVLHVSQRIFVLDN